MIYNRENYLECQFCHAPFASIINKDWLYMKIFLKFKIWRIKRAIKFLLKSKGIKPFIWSFGAYYIDLKYMVFVVVVPSDNEKKCLKNDSQFTNKLKSLLERFNWPESTRKFVTFDIESQETVNRENDGNWWYHYK